MFSPYGNADYVIIQTNSFWNSPQSSNAKIFVVFIEGFSHNFPHVFNENNSSHLRYASQENESGSKQRVGHSKERNPEK